MRWVRVAAISACAAATAPIAPLLAQGSDVSISPFVSFLPTSGRSPLPGFALTIAGTPTFGLRLNARTALRKTNVGEVGTGSRIPPWGADADAVFALSGHPFGSSNRSVSTSAFIGFGAAATDTATSRVVTKNWSYGLGTTLPLGSILDVFLDSRWRMSRFVLPTASPHPTRTKELRFGLTFHVGGTDRGNDRRRGW
ncbi:MAG: hypothetical protein ABJF01_26595 [bacterium]